MTQRKKRSCLEKIRKAFSNLKRLSIQEMVELLLHYVMNRLSCILQIQDPIILYTSSPLLPYFTYLPPLMPGLIIIGPEGTLAKPFKSEVKDTMMCM